MSGSPGERRPDGPFATLIAVAAACCGPDACDGAYASLVRRARAPAPGDEEIRVFAAELRQVLADPGLLPGDELSAAVEYGAGGGEAFVRRLWQDLYGDPPCSIGLSEAVPGGRAGPGLPAQEADRPGVVDAAYYEDLAGRLYGLLIAVEDRLGPEQARWVHHVIEVGEYGLALEDIAGMLGHTGAPVTDQERSDILALAATMTLEDDLVPRALGSCPPAGQPR